MPYPDQETVFKRLAIRQCNRFTKGKDSEKLWDRARRRAPKLPEAYEYIYGLVDPRNNRIRYVGRTKSPLGIRLSQHITTTENGESYKQRWIRGLIIEGYSPLIVTICVVPTNLAARVEGFVIRRLSQEAGPLVNTSAMKRYLFWLERDVRKQMKCPMPPSHLLDGKADEVRQEINKRIEKVLFSRRWPKISG